MGEWCGPGLVRAAPPVRIRRNEENRRSEDDQKRPKPKRGCDGKGMRQAEAHKILTDAVYADLFDPDGEQVSFPGGNPSPEDT